MTRTAAKGVLVRQDLQRWHYVDQLSPAQIQHKHLMATACRYPCTSIICVSLSFTHQPGISSTSPYPTAYSTPPVQLSLSLRILLSYNIILACILRFAYPTSHVSLTLARFVFSPAPLLPFRPSRPIFRLQAWSSSPPHTTWRPFVVNILLTLGKPEDTMKYTFPVASAKNRPRDPAESPQGAPPPLSSSHAPGPRATPRRRRIPTLPPAQLYIIRFR